MRAFDPRGYEREVVRPLRGQTVKVPDDLLTRYAVDLGMSDEELERRLREVRSHWNINARSQAKGDSTRRVYKSFLTLDEQLRREHGDELSRMSWWRRYSSGRTTTRGEEIKAFAELLRSGYGAVGAITDRRLAVLRERAPGLGDAEIDKALTESGVQVLTAVELPRESGLQPTLYHRLRALLATAALASVPQLIYPDLVRFTVLDTFRAEPAAAKGLSADAVAEAVRREDRRSANREVREALGLLASAAKDGVDLRALTLFHLLEAVREHHRSGEPAVVLLAQLAEVPWNRDEAVRAVLSVLDEARTPPLSGAQKVMALLAEGRLIAARHALVSVPEVDVAEASALVARHGERVRSLRSDAYEALRAGRDDDAVRRLREAVELSVDDDELAAELGRLPAPPVHEVRAHLDRHAVRLSWRPSVCHDELTSYRVVRRTGRIPSDSEDGMVVVVQSDRVVVDHAVPAGHVVGYAVFASVDGQTWSRPAGVTIDVFPPVYDVVVDPADDAVVGRWSVHGDATGVEVFARSGDDRPWTAISTHGLTQFQDAPLMPGVTRSYRLTACYRGANGAVARSAEVRVETRGIRAIEPISAIRVVPVEGGGPGATVAISWRQHGDEHVAIRRSEQACPWEFGARLSIVDMEGYGQPVTGGRTEDGDVRTVTADVPAGRFWYVPFTVGASGALRGQETFLVSTPPVSGLAQRRFGTDVVISWSWPESAGTADVRWSGPATSGQRRMTRQQYLDEGGCRLPHATDELRVEVSNVITTGDGEYVSVPVGVDVPAPAPSLSYSVRRRRTSLWGKEKVHVTLRSDQPLPRCDVVIVTAQGHTMPRRAADGHVVLRASVALGPGTGAELSEELPKLRKPYWIRCFVEFPADVRVDDPSIAQLKVS